MLAAHQNTKYTMCVIGNGTFQHFLNDVAAIDNRQPTVLVSVIASFQDRSKTFNKTSWYLNTGFAIPSFSRIPLSEFIQWISKSFFSFCSNEYFLNESNEIGVAIGSFHLVFVPLAIGSTGTHILAHTTHVKHQDHNQHSWMHGLVLWSKNCQKNKKYMQEGWKNWHSMLCAIFAVKAVVVFLHILGSFVGYCVWVCVCAWMSFRNFGFT